MLLDLPTDLSGGRSGGLVFPSIEEFSTVRCDPHNQCFSVVSEAEVDVFLRFSSFSYDPLGVVSETEVDIFLEPSYLLYDSMVFGNLISGSSAFSKSSLNIWKFLVHVLLKPHLENLEHYFASM